MKLAIRIVSVVIALELVALVAYEISRRQDAWREYREANKQWEVRGGP